MSIIKQDEKNKIPQITFTTTLPDALLRELDRAAQETGMRKKDIVIETFTLWKEERRQVLLANKKRGGKRTI